MDAIQELMTLPNQFFGAAFLLVGVALALKRVPPREWGGYFVSLGILGTFTGILWALMGFDTAAIDQSVPRLLDGMRTAFATSVVGMALAIISRLGSTLTTDRARFGDPTALDYYLELQKQTEALKAVQRSIGGDGDKSLLTQIQLMRADMSEFHKKLGEQSTEALIQALEKVIGDFNHNLTTQFGENFKALNEAVGRMVGWLDQHRDLVEQSHEQLRAAIVALQNAGESQERAAIVLAKVAQAAAQVATEAQRGVAAVQPLPGLLASLRQEVQGYTGDATALSTSVAFLAERVQVFTEAQGALTTALQRLDELAATSADTTQALRVMGQTAADGSVQVVKLHEETQRAVREGGDTLRTEIRQSHSHAVGSVEEMTTRTLGHMTKLHEETQRSLREGGEMLSEEILRANEQVRQAMREEVLKEVKLTASQVQKIHRELMEQVWSDLRLYGQKNHEAIEQQVQALDNAMEEQLQKSMNLLAGKLASLSEKFVRDYTPLTNELARLVQLARQAQDARQRGPHG